MEFKESRLLNLRRLRPSGEKLQVTRAISEKKSVFPRHSGGPNTVSESTVSNTELSEFSLPSPSSSERTQWVALKDKCSGRTFHPVDWGATEGGGGGFHTAVRGTMFVCNGAMTPGPSRECDITFLVKGRPKSAPQLRDITYSGGAQCAGHNRTVIPGDARLSFPRVKVPCL